MLWWPPVRLSMSSPGISSAAPLSRRATRPAQAGDTIVRFLSTKDTSLGPREFLGVAATSALCQQDGVSLDMRGADLSPLANGPLSWDHKFSVGTITRAWTTADELMIRAEMLPKGADKFVDGLTDRLKAGAPQNLSIHFEILAAEPIVPGRPERGIRATRWRASEVALVLVGADPGAYVTARKGASSMKSAAPSVESALDDVRAFGRCHSSIGDAHERADEHRSRLNTALRGLHSAIASGDKDGAAEHYARAKRAHAELRREYKTIADGHGDATDALASIARGLRAVEGSFDTDSQLVQTSGGTGDSTGSEGGRSAEWHRRQREIRILELEGIAQQYDP